MRLIIKEIEWKELTIVGPIPYGAFYVKYKVFHPMLRGVLIKNYLFDRGNKNPFADSERREKCLAWFNKKMVDIETFIESKLYEQ